LHFLWAFRLITERASFLPHNLLVLNLSCIRSEWHGCKRFESPCYSSRLDVGRSSKWALSSVVWSIHSTSPCRGSTSKWNTSFRVMHYCGVMFVASSALYVSSCYTKMWYRPVKWLFEIINFSNNIYIRNSFLKLYRMFYSTWYFIVIYIVKLWVRR
jgi:hypothetical protein